MRQTCKRREDGVMLGINACDAHLRRGKRQVFTSIYSFIHLVSSHLLRPGLLCDRLLAPEARPAPPTSHALLHIISRPWPVHECPSIYAPCSSSQMHPMRTFAYACVAPLAPDIGAQYTQEKAAHAKGPRRHRKPPPLQCVARVLLTESHSTRLSPAAPRSGDSVLSLPRTHHPRLHQ